MQEDETNIIDQAVESTVDATPDIETPETAGSEDKLTRTLKLNRSATSTTEETSTAEAKISKQSLMAITHKLRKRENSREAAAIGETGIVVTDENRMFHRKIR